MIKIFLTISLVVLANAASAQIGVNNSGTLLSPQPEIGTALAATGSIGALTLEGSGSVASFTPPLSASAVTSSVPEVTNNGYPTVFAPETGSAFSAMTTDLDPLPSPIEILPVPEPATFGAATLAAATLLWRLRDRFVGVRRFSLNAP